MRIFGLEITIVPASGPKTVHEIAPGDYKDAPLADVLSQAGLKLESMQLTGADGTPIDPKTFRVTGSVARRQPPTRITATERVSGS